MCESSFTWTVKSHFRIIQFSSVAQSFLTLCDPMDCSSLGFPVHYQLLELAQTHVHRVSDDIQPSHLLSSPSPPAFNLSQHQGLFQWVSSSHQVAKVLEFQHQSFHWTLRTDSPPRPRTPNKVCHCFHCFPIYLPWNYGTRCHDLHQLDGYQFEESSGVCNGQGSLT